MIARTSTCRLPPPSPPMQRSSLLPSASPSPPSSPFPSPSSGLPPPDPYSAPKSCATHALPACPAPLLGPPSQAPCPSGSSAHSPHTNDVISQVAYVIPSLGARGVALARRPPQHGGPRPDEGLPAHGLVVCRYARGGWEGQTGRNEWQRRVTSFLLQVRSKSGRETGDSWAMRSATGRWGQGTEFLRHLTPALDDLRRCLRVEGRLSLNGTGRMGGTGGERY